MRKPISTAVVTYITRGKREMPFTPYWLAEDHDVVGWGLTKDDALADLAARTGRRYNYEDEAPFSTIEEMRGSAVSVEPIQRPNAATWQRTVSFGPAFLLRFGLWSAACRAGLLRLLRLELAGCE